MMRLAKRRNNPNKKQRTPANSSRIASIASDETSPDAAAGADAAANAAAVPAVGSGGVPVPCKLDRQEQQLPVSGSSGSSSQHCCWGAPAHAPVSTVVSAGEAALPHLAGAGSMAVEGNQMLISFDSTASSAACWGGAAVPGAAPAGVAGSCAYTLPHLKDVLQGIDDAESLQLMLESELTAAALGAAIATRSSAPLDPESRQMSQKLAAALVQDSGLFDDDASDMQLSAVASAPMAAAHMTHAPPVKPSLGVMYSQHSLTGSCFSDGGVSSSGHMAFAPSAAAGALSAPWGGQGAFMAQGAPQMFGAAGNMMMAAPACSSSCMPAQAASMGAWPAQIPVLGNFPLLSQMPCFPGVGAQLPSMQFGTGAACAGGPAAAAGQVERMQELRQQMVQLQCRVHDLRCQMGL